MYTNDNRIVMTLDAGGTNFVFSAIKGNQEIVSPVIFPSNADNLEKCLNTIKEGFCIIKKELKADPVAISFAFPGPADYKNGIIGDLPNFPSFRGGVALGDFLRENFDIPVFINNDGNLFAYGEALAGLLPEVNNNLKNAGNTKQYKNLLGITIGTGFGAGIVINNILNIGDNECGGDVWLLPNKKFPNIIAEESVSIRAIQRVYQEIVNDNSEKSPKDIFEIAEGIQPGNKEAAIKSFEDLGEAVGDVISRIINVLDGLVVIGGGLSGAEKYIFPAILKELNSTVGTFDNSSYPALQMEVFNLSDSSEYEEFLKEKSSLIKVPFSKKQVRYNQSKKTGIAISKLGAAKAISLGAYAFALEQLNKKENKLEINL